FVQAQPSFAAGRRLSSLVVAAEQPGTELALQGCCFLGFGRLTAREGRPDEPVLSGVDPGGQDAVLRRGPARISAVDCAFGPHACTFRLEGEGGLVRVRQCSVLAARRSAVLDLPVVTRDRVAVAGGATLEVSHSLFSRAGETGGGHSGDGDAAVL